MDLIIFFLDLDIFIGPFYICFQKITVLLDLRTIPLDLILPSSSTQPFPKPYPFWINFPIFVPRLHRNFWDSRALELR